MSHLVIVGAGGNIGSHLVPLIGRSSQITRVTLIDRDRYERKNLSTQAIERGDVGKPKVHVQARRLRQITKKLRITALHSAVEDVPLAALRADVIAACLDSRISRMNLNQAASRIGVPWINAGVDGGAMLARVQTFVSGADQPCLECAWDKTDYAAVEQPYPCHPSDGPAASGASASLGALAASLQAIEIEKVVARDRAHALIGRDLLLDAKHHRQFVTTFRHNNACRMPDHAGWRIAPLNSTAAATTLSDLVALGSILRGADERLSLRVAGQHMVVSLTCTGCGARRAGLAVERSLRDKTIKCRTCKSLMKPLGFDLVSAARLSDVDEWDWPLLRFGIQNHDVLTLVTPQVEAHYEVGGPR